MRPAATVRVPGAGATPPGDVARPGRLGRARLLAGYLLAILVLSGPALGAETLRGIGWHLLPGLHLVVLLLGGLTWTPLLLLGPLLLGAGLDPLPVGWPVLAVWSAALAGGALLGALALRHGLGLDLGLRRVRDVNALIVVALLQPLPVAALGVLVLARAGLVPWSSFPADVVTWWIGNAIGTLTLAPALLLVAVAWGAARAPKGLRVERGDRSRARRPRAPGRAEIAAQGLSLAAAVWLPFGSPIAHEVRLLYLGFLPLLWIALRHGLRGATLAVLALNVGTILAIRSVETPPAGLADLQLLLLGFALTGLFLGAVTTARQRAEAALRASEARFRAIFDRALDALVILGDDGRILAANPAAVPLLGLPADRLREYGIFDLCAPRQDRALRRAWRRLLAVGEQAGTLELVRPDGMLRRAEYAATARIAPGRHLAILRDVTDRLRLEAELRQSHKTEAVGRLAGGVAHHFNNLLAVIQGYAETLSKDLPADDPLRHDAEEIRTAAGRAAALVRQLLAFSRRQSLEPVPLDLDALVSALAPTLRDILGEAITLVVSGGQALGHVRADAGQVRQAIINLAVNARDAMPAGGRLTLETALVELDEAFARAHPGVAPGPHVALRVTDTGGGMSPEVLQHLFEPFFTTHDVGQGTGLGLSSVYGIVRQHHGAITVASSPGRGSTFTLYFPRLRVRPGGAGARTILLVTDDLAARQGLRGLLVQDGHTVLEAANGGEALFIAEWHEDPIDLLVVAADLPQLPGPELAARLRAARPELRVLLVSEPPAGGAAPAPGPGGLAWPAPADSVRERIEDALARPAARG